MTEQNLIEEQKNEMIEHIKNFNEYALEDQHYDIIINCLLVKSKIRNAFMIQWIDYQEENENGPITSRIIKIIKKIFPEFHHVCCNQGIIISLKKLDFDSKKYTEKELGEILSLPCPGDINNNRNYSVSFDAVINKTTYQILVSVCGVKNKHNDLFDQIHSFIDSLNNINNNDNKINDNNSNNDNKINDKINEDDIKLCVGYVSCECVIRKIYTVIQLIDKATKSLTNNSEMKNCVKDEIANYFANYGMSILFVAYQKNINIFRHDILQFIIYLLWAVEFEDTPTNENESKIKIKWIYNVLKNKYKLPLTKNHYLESLKLY